MRTHLLTILLGALVVSLSGCASGSATIKADTESQQPPIREDLKGNTMKTDTEWRDCLTPEQYRILREKGTERAFTGKYYHHKEKGMYLCAGCGAELFASDTKFDSGTGWPSFYKPAADGAVAEHRDLSFGMIRVEVTCANCGGHLGHVFDDGPNPTGLRYCINSTSLGFKAAEK